MAPRRGLGLGLAVVIVAAAALFACSGGGGSKSAATDGSITVPPTTPDGPVTCPNVSAGGGGGGGTPPASVPTPSTDPRTANPFDALGARQRVDGSTTTTLIPSAPVSAVVETPVNPDFDVPASRGDPNVSNYDILEGKSTGEPAEVALPVGPTPTTWPVVTVTIPFCASGDTGGLP